MNSFNQFGLTPNIKTFTGDKIKIERLINRQIVVYEYKIETSKFEKGSGRCLQIQIGYNGAKHVVFTGSTVLMDLIERVPKTSFPFTATIVKDNEYYEFK